jgi:FtsK/SpoIIIE family
MVKQRQMRRHAHRMRRAGLQPMIVINSDDPTPDLAAVLISRWLWRYRSELTPLYLTLTTVTAASILHATHPRSWPWILTATTLAAFGLAILGRRVGLTRPIERIYATTVTTMTGAWLVAATAIGPMHPPLPRTLIGAVVLAVPWWAHRRRRARVRVERQLAAWPDIADSIGLAGARVMTAVVDAWGWTARMALRRGHTVTDALTKLPAIESALGTRPGAVRIEADPDRADHFLMRVLHTDPHSRPVPWQPSDIRSITQPIPLGVFEDATPATVLLLRRNGLIGGVVGSGKSGVLNVILAALAVCEDVVIWGIDLKGGMELRPWTPALGRLATTPEQATALFRDAVTELDRRATQSGTDGSRVWGPTRDKPALLIVVDEYAELPDEATDVADSIARRGRAVAVTLLAATQRPTQKAMGHGATRSQMDIRISLRVRERRDVDLILGQGSYNAGWHAHTLDAPGKFLISAPEHLHPKRARAHLITDHNVTTTAHHHAPHRPVLHPPQRDESPPDCERRPQTTDSPEVRLWQALLGSPDEGASVRDLMHATGMGRSWVYYRLQEHADIGRAERMTRGRWRAISPPESDDHP